MLEDAAPSSVELSSLFLLALNEGHHRSKHKEIAEPNPSPTAMLDVWWGFEINCPPAQ